jgi:hypothetical protein
LIEARLNARARAEDELLSELTINNTRADTSGNGREAGTLNKRRKRIMIRPRRKQDWSFLCEKDEHQIGDEMPDGTIYAGISPDTHQPMYATPRDAPGTYTFNEAASYAKNLDPHGRHDFHAPSKGELNVLWENRNEGKLKGTFNDTGLLPTGRYWSSKHDSFNLGWVQHFCDGYQDFIDRGLVSSLRCVR